jgi:hypothetical protein
VNGRVIRRARARTLCQCCMAPAKFLVQVPGTDAKPRHRCRGCVLAAVEALIDTVTDEGLSVGVNVTSISREG